MVNILPFASTFIRGLAGLVGFAIIMLVKGESKTIISATKDAKTMLCTLASTITGPFIGVSLSLMATLYTSTGIAQTIMATTPIFILLPSWLFFHQKIKPIEILGAIIAVLGVALFFI